MINKTVYSVSDTVTRVTSSISKGITVVTSDNDGRKVLID
jgi:hypothetical protein